jgi:hypothetical protein
VAYRGKSRMEGYSWWMYIFVRSFQNDWGWAGLEITVSAWDPGGIISSPPPLEVSNLTFFLPIDFAVAYDPLGSMKWFVYNCSAHP